MKQFVVLAVLLSLSLVAFIPVQAHEGCEAVTIEALRHCVHHALEAGHITNVGVANSLFAKLDAAQASLNRGNTHTAINQLQAFINAVGAQAGKHIVSEHAEHMIHHAHGVIAALS